MTNSGASEIGLTGGAVPPSYQLQTRPFDSNRSSAQPIPLDKTAQVNRDMSARGEVLE